MAANTGSRGQPIQHHFSALPTTDSTDQLSTHGSDTKVNNWSTTVSHVASWPQEARALKNHTWLTFIYGIGDFILVLLPVYFIRKSQFADFKTQVDHLRVLAAAAAALNGTPTKDNDFGRKVEFAMDLVCIFFGCRCSLTYTARVPPCFPSSSQQSADEA